MGHLRIYFVNNMHFSGKIISNKERFLFLKFLFTSLLHIFLKKLFSELNYELFPCKKHLFERFLTYKKKNTNKLNSHFTIEKKKSLRFNTQLRLWKAM